VDRREAFADDPIWAGRSRTEAGTWAGWHVHPGHDTQVFQTQGRLRLEFGPGGTESVEGGPGDFVLIPRAWSTARGIRPPNPTKRSSFEWARAKSSSTSTAPDRPAPVSAQHAAPACLATRADVSFPGADQAEVRRSRGLLLVGRGGGRELPSGDMGHQGQVDHAQGRVQQPVEHAVRVADSSKADDGGEPHGLYRCSTVLACRLTKGRHRMRADASDGDARNQVPGLTPRVMPVLRAELVGAALRSGRGPSCGVATGARVSALGDETQPGAGAVPARTSSAPGRSGLVLVSLVYFLFPKKQEEEPLLAQYRGQDTPRPAGPTPRRIAT
jgi:hypothetical protein